MYLSASLTTRVAPGRAPRLEPPPRPCEDCEDQATVEVVLGDGSSGVIECPACVPNDALGG